MFRCKKGIVYVQIKLWINPTLRRTVIPLDHTVVPHDMSGSTRDTEVPLVDL